MEIKIVKTEEEEEEEERERERERNWIKRKEMDVAKSMNETSTSQTTSGYFIKYFFKSKNML